jgi:DNA topoisomerase-1
MTATERALDPSAPARAAGLRHVSDSRPGIRREPAGDGFRYIGPDGEQVEDEATLARIRSLAIPPAYTDVWICPDPRGHIQATGRDAKGRKQYRYHPRWRAVRDETKYHRTIAFGRALPRIRARVAEDLKRPGMPREKVLAALVRLLETTLIRVGNDEYARANRSYGLTTLRDRHVQLDGAQVTFAFRGKSGKFHRITLHDRRLASVIRRSRDLPGQELFQYQDDSGQVVDIGSDHVNAYLREIAGEEFTAKDVRTWVGTVLAAQTLHALGGAETAAETKRKLKEAIESVAGRLGNTPAICRACYVHPLVLESYLDGTLLEALAAAAAEELADDGALSAEERMVLRLLEGRMKRARGR